MKKLLPSGGGAHRIGTRCLTQGKLKAGERVLIHAAAGGVGVFAVQIAKAVGAYVAATAAQVIRTSCATGRRSGD